MKANKKITFNINYIKKNIFSNIKQIIFKWNGIIFGEFVRDYIISEHYIEQYNKKYNYKNDKNIWNIHFDKQTIARTLINDNINILIKDNSNIIYIIEEITNYFIQHFGKENILITHLLINNMNDNAYLYVDNNSIINKYNYNILIGKIPYITEGINININIYIIILTKNQSYSILDFLCNGFIMTEYNISLSNHTGIELDKLGILEKKYIEQKIIKDIINFTTDYSFKFPKLQDVQDTIDTINYNELALKSIEKLIKHSYKWNIRNLPILYIHPSNINSLKFCCYCFISFAKKDYYIGFSYENNINGSYMHKKCFIEYINIQLKEKKKLINNIFKEEDLLLKCPMNKTINFNNINTIIDNYI